MTRQLTGTELRQLEQTARRGSPVGRAVAEIRTRRQADSLTPAKLRSLESVRALVEDQGGDHRAELEVLDEILHAHGVYPDEPQETDAQQDGTPARSPRIPPSRGWPFT